ncbi:beta-Ala-His dipeptidase [Miltoncostaea oceani]|jgi:dipeptidase D|uniref:beta-Ala-His dipeptidase n=1 Tax=Miltoncostaea oceani TaxID=2843216 RepID=UPI001C3C40DC|nr:beta-Ala-His dipeptidase [Miltoncostaea oceani]
MTTESASGGPASGGPAPGDWHEALAGLEPRRFWERFGELTTIARPSRKEEAVIAWVDAWSGRLGLSSRRDAAGNTVISVPATPGREQAPTVVLQGHLDMVCERDPESPNDPAEGRIRLVRDGEWLTADGTTLGADDGVAIAAMMALVEDGDIPHGPLELLMTVAEEVGLEGANNLDGAMVTGSVLVNLDSEEDGRITVGCAGSTDTWIDITAAREPATPGAVSLRVAVSGGLGGHSGTNIAAGRANAVKVLGRALGEALAEVPFRLVAMDGGRSRNAIPRDAAAVVQVPADATAAFGEAVARAEAVIRDACSVTDPGVTVTVTPDAGDGAPAWTSEATRRMLDAVAVIPTGPLAMSPAFDDLVETSTSLGEAVTDGDVLTLHSLSRSSNDAAMPDLIGTLQAAARLAGGTIRVRRNYAGWRPDMGSPVLAATIAAYTRALGEDPIVTAVHAGLESAVIATRVPGELDMVSFGPQIEAPHSPDERVSTPTVERFWRLLLSLVDELSAPAVRG